MTIGADHRRALHQEMIVSTAINSLVPAAIIWLVDLAPPDTLLGANGIVGPMSKASGLATFAMTLILTLIVRHRVRGGGLPALDWPNAERGLMRFQPRMLLLRAIANALLAVVLLVPAGLVVVAIIHILPLDKIGFLMFNLVFGAIVGIVMTRFVVLPALADPVQR